MKRILGLMAVLVTLALGTSVLAGAFSPGDIVVYRVGDGTQPVTNLGQSVFLDEYTTNAIIAAINNACNCATPLQTIAMPSTWVGNQAPLIADGPSAQDGIMNLSVDGRYLVVPGFAATIGQLTNLTGYAFPNVSSNADVGASDATNAVTEADVPRVIGLVDGNGNVYTTTVITNGNEEGDDIRTAASLDGTNIWYAGGDGLRIKYTTRGSLVSTQVCANSSLEPSRAVGIYSNASGYALYTDKNVEFAVAMNTTAIYTNIVGGVTNIATVNPFGGALPVVTYPTNFTQVSTNVVPLSAQAFTMFRLEPGAGPADTLYLADSTTNFPGESRNYAGAILKFCNVGGNWVFQGAIGAEDALGVAGIQNGSSVQIFATEGTNDELYYYNDTSGYNNPIGNQNSSQIYLNGDSSGVQAGLINARGVTPSPQGGDSGTITGPGLISVGPPYGPYFRGPQGGPFTPAGGVQYSLANLGTASVGFQVTYTAGFNDLTAVPASGTIASGSSATVTLYATNSSAINLNGGVTYTGNVIWHTGNAAGVAHYTNTATIVVDAFYLTPTTNFISLGEPGVFSSYSPSSATYALSNATAAPLSFTAFTSNNWTTLTCPIATQVDNNHLTGTVGGHSNAYITVSINANVDSLVNPGSYDDYLVITNTSASPASQLSVTPEIILQAGFGIFDDFSTYAVGPVVGQNGWRVGAAADTGTVTIDYTTLPGGTIASNLYVVPGGCPSANGSAQQPYKYVAASPITNAMYICATNVVDSTNVYVMCNVPTYAITGVLITFTNAPSASNYIFEQGNTYLNWNDAGIEANGGGYSWTTELNQYQTGGGPVGSAVYQFGTQYQVFFMTDFVESNAWIFVNPPGPSIDPTAEALVNDPGVLATNLAVYSNGAGADACPAADCIGTSAQGWESIVLGQYSSCPGTVQPGYFVTRVAASTNYADVWNWLNPTNSAPSANSYSSWDTAYFTAGGGITNPAVSGGNVDLYGTGMSNTNKFLAGFSGTNATAYLHIISIASAVAGGQTNVTVTYLGANGDTSYSPGFSSRTNILEYSTGTGNGSYTNNFLPTGQTNILSGGTGLGVVTNMTDSAIPASADRYYRVRVLLP